MEKNLQSTVKPSQHITGSMEANAEDMTAKTVLAQEQQDHQVSRQSATDPSPPPQEPSASPSLSSPGNISPILWDADDSCVNLIEVTVDEFPADHTLVLDPVTGLFVPEAPDPISTPWCSMPIHQSELPPVPPAIDLGSSTNTNQEMKETISVPDEGTNVILANDNIVSTPPSKIKTVPAPIQWRIQDFP